MEQTATQKLYWDTDENIVWGELDSTPQTLQTAEENIKAQARIRDALGKEMTRVLIDMRQTTRINRQASNHYAGKRTASTQRATALLVASPLSATIANFFMGLNKPLSPHTDVHQREGSHRLARGLLRQVKSRLEPTGPTRVLNWFEELKERVPIPLIMRLEPGTTLGHYAVTAKIGEGGMGQVYRARDTRAIGTCRSKCFDGHSATGDLRHTAATRRKYNAPLTFWRETRCR